MHTYIHILLSHSFPDVMMESYKDKPLAPLFFVIFLIIAFYLVLNVLLGVVYSTFRYIQKKKFKRTYFRKRQQFCDSNYIRMHVYSYIHMCIYTYICIYVSFLCMYVCAYVCLYERTHQLCMYDKHMDIVCLVGLFFVVLQTTYIVHMCIYVCNFKTYVTVYIRNSIHTYMYIHACILNT